MDNLLSYNKEWKFKGFWDGHEEKVNAFCANMFYQQERNMGLGKDDSETKGKSGNYDKSSVFGTTANYY